MVDHHRRFGLGDADVGDAFPLGPGVVADAGASIASSKVVVVADSAVAGAVVVMILAL